MSGYEYVLIYLFYFILLISHRKGGEGEGERGNEQTNKIPIWAYNALLGGP